VHAYSFSAVPAASRQRGYSLHDALITLGIAAILAGVGIPSITRLILRQEQVTAINTLIAALHTARSEAITRGNRVALCPSRDGQNCLDAGGGQTAWHAGYLLYVDLDASSAREDGEPAVRYFDGRSRIRTFTSRYRDHITYQANGFASGTNTTFRFCDPAGRIASRAVVVSNTGRPRISSDNDTCPADDG
jgi:type IV fimbrial biogenesis protein FimT